MRRLRNLALLLTVGPLLASTPSTWEMSTFTDFLRGRLTNVAVSRDGSITLAPALRSVFDSQQPVIWAVAQSPDGTIYAGTGHRGRVYRIEPNGQSSLLWTAEQAEVFALATQGNGVVYAATSPDGKVYRLQNGKAAEYFDPKSHYIWSLAVGNDGALYVGTGDQGKVYRVTAAGQGELYYDTTQSHVTALAIDREGRVLAGSEPNGVLYRITAKDKAFVLYDASLPEIHSITVAPDGIVYVAALGGSVNNKVASATSATSTSVTTTTGTPTVSVTVTGDAAAQTGPNLQPKPAADPTKTAVTATQAITAPAQAVTDLTGVERSALYRIDGQNQVETLWSSKEENAFDLLIQNQQIYFATDKDGRVYRLGSDRKTTLLAQTNEGEAVRLLLSGDSFLVATGTLGKLYRLGQQPGVSGSYESPVHDAGGVARWGRLSWAAAVPSGAQAAFRTRTGNTARPDATWSDWSNPITAEQTITSPNARYIQWKADLTGTAAASPELQSVTVAYLPQNTIPIVKSINASLFFTPSVASKGATAATNTAATYSVTVSDTGDTSTSSSGTPTQQLLRASSQQLLVSWQAEDADSDRLAYTIYARGEGEREWKLLRKDITDTSLNIDSEILADGKYLFRVVASDKLSNPASAAREGELVSPPVMLDNTPPVVKLTAATKTANSYSITGEASDTTSALRRIEYAVDAGVWLPAEPADGIIDSPREAFTIKIEGLNPGEHVISVRAFDAANNAGLAKQVLR